ncbi:MAG: hypothetical protein AB7T06_27805 [Kofleriaceae bacterium]
MAVPPQLLQQLLALDESVRREIAHALLASVDPSDDDGMSNADREKLHASIERSIAQSDAGQGIPIEQAIAQIRAKRADRARGLR